MTSTHARRGADIDRRTFARSASLALAGLLAGATGTRAAERQLKIGCTGLIFRATPNAPENLADALTHMSALGYHCFETWGSVLAYHDEKGTLGDLIAKHGVPLRSAFMGITVHDPSKLKESIAQTVAWGKVLTKHGGTFAVVNAGADRKTFSFKDSRAQIIAGLNDHGKALNDLGLGAGLHQHTGSAVDVPEEVYTVMEQVDTRYMKFAPDVGQLQKAGGDAAKIVRDFRTIVVHMHLKDYSGGEHFAGYCPLGQGKVDLVDILNTVETSNPKASVMVELDGSAKQPYTPRQTAEISRDYLRTLGYAFRA